jgi:hypothetical protein
LRRRTAERRVQEIEGAARMTGPIIETAAPSRAVNDLRLLALALALGAVVQGVMWIGYGVATEWCFCAIDGAPTPNPPGWLIRTITIAAWPVDRLPNLPAVVITGPLINLIIWTAAFFAVLKPVTVLVHRLRER